MKLLTKAIERAMPGIGRVDDADKARVQVKFFTPTSSWTWYAIEGERCDDGDYLFFGLVEFQFAREWGYFKLRELEAARGPLGVGVERDMYFGNPTIEEVRLTLDSKSG